MEILKHLILWSSHIGQCLLDTGPKFAKWFSILSPGWTEPMNTVHWYHKIWPFNVKLTRTINIRQLKCQHQACLTVWTVIILIFNDVFRCDDQNRRFFQFGFLAIPENLHRGSADNFYPFSSLSLLLKDCLLIFDKFKKNCWLN